MSGPASAPGEGTLAYYLSNLFSLALLSDKEINVLEQAGVIRVVEILMAV